MAAFTFELFPQATLHIALFSGVTNAADLKAAIPNLDCALMSTDLICSVQHILCAANRALHNEFRGEKKTRNLYTDLIYYLSPTTNIKESLQKWGVHEDSRNLLAVSFSVEGMQQVQSAVQGVQEPIHRLSEYCDFRAIQAAFEISDGELELDRSLTAAVYSRIALKDYKKS